MATQSIGSKGCQASRARRRVLVLCTGNSCRSQMAEAFLAARGADLVEAHSAGSHPTGSVHPLAIEVMAELGFDLARHRSKSLQEFDPAQIDVVVTVCDAAQDSCPNFPGDVERHHWSFPDPAAARGTEKQVRAAFLSVRDAISSRIDSYLEELRAASPEAAAAPAGE